MSELLEFLGAPGSPYTRKMLSLLRYRRIPYKAMWSMGMQVPEGYPKPKYLLFPTFFLKGEDGEPEAVTDSTPLIQRIEKEYSGRNVFSTDPVLAFLTYLIEDYADEWLSKAMFHYRWSQQPDIDHAADFVIYSSAPSLPKEQASQYIEGFKNRQISRLYVVGSNEITGPIIERSYERFVAILDELLEGSLFVAGHRPSAADFAIYGQLTQLAGVDLTPTKRTKEISPRVSAWVVHMDELSGLDVSDSDWISKEQYADRLGPLLSEIGRVYVPFLLANADAVAAGEKQFETQIDGSLWTQPSFPYQAKCLRWIREEFGALSDEDRGSVLKILAGTGCDALLENEVR